MRYFVYLFCWLLSCNSLAQHANSMVNVLNTNSPDVVINGGYYTNTPFPYSQGWHLDFSDVAIIEIVVPEAGVLEVRSPTLSEDTDIWLRLGSASGPIIENPADVDFYAPTVKAQHFYLSQDLLNANSQRVFIHIEAQDNGDQPHAVVVQVFTDVPPFLNQSLGMIENYQFRTFVESYRNNMIWEINDIGENVRTQLEAIATFEALVGDLTLPLEFDDITKQYSYLSPDIDTEEFIGEAMYYFLTTFVDIPDTHVDEYAVLIADYFQALGDMRKGNFLPAIQMLITNGAEAGVYVNGIRQLYLNQDYIDAMILAEVVMRDSLNNGLPMYSDNALIAKAEEFVDDLAIEFGCDDFLWFNCFNSNYDTLEFILTYRNLETMVLEHVQEYQLMSGKFEDVDFDGFTNQEEINDGGDPNDPDIIPQSATNRCPAVSMTLSSTNVLLGQNINAEAVFNDPDGDTPSHLWTLLKPAGSSASLSSTNAPATSFQVDVEGSYTLTLSSTDGYCERAYTRVVSGIEQYDEDDLSGIDDETLYLIPNGSIGECELRHLDFNGQNYVEVPADEIWTKITMAGSMQDIVLLMNKGSRPELDGSPTVGCVVGTTQSFDADFEMDYYVHNGFMDWNEDHQGGDRIYVAIFSYEGMNDIEPMIGEIRIDLDTDGDGVPDDEEDPACRNNPNEQYDTDGDGICNGEDTFENDPAASVDTDGDGYPNTWNPGQNQGSSTMGLTLDVFPGDPTEWTDSDNDGVGDNTDKFPNNPDASIDTDDDGFPDAWNTGITRGSSSLYIDAFPIDPAASMDTDEDGYPDSWNPGKSQDDSTTGLILDALPLDPNEHIDSDGDGFGDNSDVFPNDPNEWLDSDGDGTGDNADVAPNDPNRQTNLPPTVNVGQIGNVVAGQPHVIDLSVMDPDFDAVALTVPSGSALDFLSLGASITLLPIEGMHEGLHNFVLHAEDTFDAVTVVNVIFEVLQRFSVDVTQVGFGEYTMLVNGDEFNCESGCMLPSFEGDFITIEILPMPMTDFLGWSGDCSGIGLCELDMDDFKSVQFSVSNPDIIFMDSF